MNKLVNIDNDEYTVILFDANYKLVSNDLPLVVISTVFKRKHIFLVCCIVNKENVQIYNEIFDNFNRYIRKRI